MYLHVLGNLSRNLLPAEEVVVLANQYKIRSQWLTRCLSSYIYTYGVGSSYLVYAHSRSSKIKSHMQILRQYLPAARCDAIGDEVDSRSIAALDRRAFFHQQMAFWDDECLQWLSGARTNTRRMHLA